MSDAALSSCQKYSISKVTQDDFAAALFDPSKSPSGLTGPTGAPAGKRLDVYRNNVAVSLTEALETAFPVLQKLVGAEFFAAMAGVFLRQHPPQSPLLMFYGDAMPGFLASFPPVAHLPYLPDIARLELARRVAYHAADVRPVAADALASLPPENLPGARLTFAPAVQVIASVQPVVGLWRANAENGPAPAKTAETALVTRPGFDPEVDALPAADGALVAALLAGQPLGAALETAEGADLAGTLGLLLSRNAITEIAPC